MPQHDMNIANAVFPAVRTDINSALGALVSLSSGASAPTATFPYMLWADTTNDRLKMRNAADSAWIEVLVLSTGLPPSTSIVSILNSLVGMIAPFAGNAAPTGWLACEGAAVSRTTYANLWTFAQASGVLSVDEPSKLLGGFGPGDGSTTFTLPDYRGEFLRGWDNGKGTDTGRAIGTAQADEIESHTHALSPLLLRSAAGSDVQGGTGFGGSSSATGATGGTETRPRNVAVLYCIKT